MFEHRGVHSVGFFWCSVLQRTLLVPQMNFSHIPAHAAAPPSAARLGSLHRGSSCPPKPQIQAVAGDPPGTGWLSCGQSPARGGDPCIVPGMDCALNGISLEKGRKAVGKPACVIFPPSAVAAERRHPAHNGVKKVKGGCCGSSILNYVFMDLHNGLSDGVLLFKAQSGNCGGATGRLAGREGWRSTEGGKRGKLKT